MRASFDSAARWTEHRAPLLAVIGARIRAARDDAGLTQADLGRACGVAANTIARIERGEQEPASLLLGAIARALAVSADHLLGSA